MVDPYLRIAPGLYCFLPQLNLRQELLLAACLLARRGMLASNSPGLGDASAGCPPTGQVVTCSVDEIIRPGWEVKRDVLSRPCSRPKPPLGTSSRSSLICVFLRHEYIAKHSNLCRLKGAHGGRSCPRTNLYKCTSTLSDKLVSLPAWQLFCSLQAHY